jgi:FKBP-type peptidyl-prolyl cis-trans isomerase SlyD
MASHDSGSGELERIGKHKAVTVTYRISDSAGLTVEQNDLPVGYVHGCDSGLFPKVEQALGGHVSGDRIEVTLSPDEAFGAHDPDLTFVDEIDNVPPQFRRVGAEVEMVNARNEPRTFRVTGIADGQLTVDGNHPLAGQTVTFHVHVHEVRNATAEEIAAGRF